jgi:triacylglycerol lipase
MRFASLLVFLCLSLGLGAGTPGSLRYGAVPAGSGTRPVLLFVHGWNSDATTWSGSNDMEAKAAASGYRTAFLDVYADRTMWDNGPIISGAVDQVKAHFPGAGVVLVCHSKGGVDGQTALVYYGASAKVDRLITLGTPHRGTPLADLAWSSWAGWLAGLLGSKNDGNRVLQTGYMASFRAQTDARPEAHVVPLYTAGGTKAGPWFSAYWYGGIAIGRTSDGVVPLDSTSLPYQGARLFTRSWNHAEVKQGFNVWPYLATALAAPPVAAFAAGPALAAAPAQGPDHALDRLYRGGATAAGMAEFTFPVDAGQPSLQVLLQTSAKPRRALLISPSGRLHRLVAGLAEAVRVGDRDEAGDETFPGAVNRQAQVARPEPGLWRVQLSAQGEDAYFFTAIFPGDAARSLSAAEALAGVRGAAPASFGAVGAPERTVHTVRTSGASVPLRGMKAQPMPEPSVLNHTLVLTWPDGRERAVIFSEAE